MSDLSTVDVGEIEVGEVELALLAYFDVDLASGFRADVNAGENGNCEGEEDE